MRMFCWLCTDLSTTSVEIRALWALSSAHSQHTSKLSITHCKMVSTRHSKLATAPEPPQHPQPEESDDDAPPEEVGAAASKVQPLRHDAQRGQIIIVQYTEESASAIRGLLTNSCARQR